MAELLKIENPKKKYNFSYMFVRKLINNFVTLLILQLLGSNTNLNGQETTSRGIQALYSRISMGVLPYKVLTGNLSCVIEINKSFGISSSLIGGVLNDNNLNIPSDISCTFTLFGCSRVDYYAGDINFRLHRINKKRNIKTGIEIGPILNYFKIPYYIQISSGWFPSYSESYNDFTNIGLNFNCNIVFTACRFYGYNVGLRANLNEHYPYVVFELGHTIGVIKRKKLQES